MTGVGMDGSLIGVKATKMHCCGRRHATGHNGETWYLSTYFRDIYVRENSLGYDWGKEISRV